jgi:hypothetical protein
MAKKMNDRPSDLASDIVNAIREGTKKWTRTRKAEGRNPASRSYRRARMTRERGVSFKDAAAQIMRAAYLKASGNNTLPANARQIMYAARDHIQKATGRSLESNYFTQTLLPNYIEENHITDWDVVYDARGHFSEPHDGNDTFGIGTLEVRDYLADLDDPSIVDAKLSQAKVKTSGPAGNFGAVLFIEKEGFSPLIERARIAEKYDVAIMSTKGMSVTAARALVDDMCFEHDIPLLLLHDFDKSGFSIAGTLQRDTRRYEFRNSIEVIDLGLSLADVEAMGLESEYQHHPKGKKSALIANLRKNGASERDIAFMFEGFEGPRCTRRVELNAMTSPQFIAFVERKLRENKVTKIVPDKDLLVKVCIGLEMGRRLEQAVAKLVPDMKGFKPPDDLERRVRMLLKKKPHIRWDAALAMIVAPDKSKRDDPKPAAADPAPSSSIDPNAGDLDAVREVLGEVDLSIGPDGSIRHSKGKTGRAASISPVSDARVDRTKVEKLIEELKAKGKDITPSSILALLRAKDRAEKKRKAEQ